jgi:predicted nucleic acid-binding protein
LKSFVVDASVAVKLLLPEPHSQAALRLLEPGRAILAPDLIWPEVGNVLWKKWRQGEVDEEAVPSILRDFQRLPFHIQPSDALAEVAWVVARSLGRSFYDSLYLALAITFDYPFVTADRRLYNALRGGPDFEVLWVEEIP